jgi:hypothetical protein
MEFEIFTLDGYIYSIRPIDHAFKIGQTLDRPAMTRDEAAREADRLSRLDSWGSYIMTGGSDD